MSMDILAGIKPKSVHGVWECVVTPQSVTLGGVEIFSKDLAKFLRGCNRAVLLAATLGAQADLLIRRLCAADMAEAVVADAACAKMLEEYISENFPGKRFSPGFGDFALVHQKTLLRLLNCDKIGLAVTDGLMLVPSKSVTAVVGLTICKR